MDKDIVIHVVENGWAIEKYGSMHATHVFNSAKQLKTFLTRWVDETRCDQSHGMRLQNGGETATPGEDGPEIPVREPEPSEFPAPIGKTD